MTYLDETTRAELVREIAQTLAKKQRLAFASDFHAFAEGRQLTLAGVTFEAFPKGPNTKRSDGDVVAHAIVMALAAAVNRGDIDDWFPEYGECRILTSQCCFQIFIRSPFGSPLIDTTPKPLYNP